MDTLSLSVQLPHDTSFKGLLPIDITTVRTFSENAGWSQPEGERKTGGSVATERLKCVGKISLLMEVELPIPPYNVKPVPQFMPRRCLEGESWPLGRTMGRIVTVAVGRKLKSVRSALRKVSLLGPFAGKI